MFNKIKYNKNLKNFSANILDENVETNMPITKNVNFNKNIHMKKFGHMLIMGDEETKFEHIKQNILKKNTNYIAVDKDGKLYEKLNRDMKDTGYNIQVIDLINFTGYYNPFLYFLNDMDILKIIHTMFKKEKDEYMFAKSMFQLIQSTMLYVYHNCDKSEQSFAKVIELLENYDEYEKTIREIEKRQPNDVVVKQFNLFCMLDKNNKNQVKNYTLNKLKEIFNKNILSMMSNTNTDENINLSFEQKTVIFVKIPNNNDDVILAMIMEQMINYIKEKAISLIGHRFKEPVRIFFDKFDCVKYFEETHVEMFITGMYGILYSILVSDINELKDIYKEDINMALNRTNILVANSKEMDLKYIIDYWKNDASMFKIKDDNKAIDFRTERMIDLDNVVLSKDDCALFVKGSYAIIDKKL